MTHDSWALFLHDQVVAWLRPYRTLFEKHGHTLDDAAQEARLALHQQTAYLERLASQLSTPYTSVLYAAKKIVIRTAIRRLVSRGKMSEILPLVESEDRTHKAHVQVEIAEMIDAAPADIRSYLLAVFSGRDGYEAMADKRTKKFKRQVAKYVMEWFVEHHNWRDKP